MPLQILVADAHQMVREGMRMLLESAGFEVVGEVSDGQEAVRLVRDLGPDVVLLDFALPVLSGLDTASEIARSSSRTRPILLTTNREPPYVRSALRAGVKGYVLKTQTGPDLIQAISEVSRGKVYLSLDIFRTGLDSDLTKPEVRLSLREREVLQLVAAGKTTREIARLLGVSIKTATAHRTRIMAKLDIHETASLVRYAIRQGLAQV